MNMEYEEISKLCEQLEYRDKFRLAQLLLQLARKEEELQNPKELFTDKQNGKDTIEYVWNRIESLQPKKRKTLINSIGAIFQFQGAIP